MATQANRSADRNPRAGEWVPVNVDGIDTARLACPRCGFRALLDDHHITCTGRVEPSVECPANCGFHDYVRLDGWGE